jgi:PadR family transcriptional regulator AphA
MSIRHAILGLLSEQPMHGYRLREAFAERVSPLWGLTTGQIYQSLAALERAGFLQSRGERAGRRPARRIYSVTESGRGELNTWLGGAPSTWARPFREDLLIRLMLLRDCDVGPLWQSLARQEDEATLHLARVVHLRASGPSRGATLDVRSTFLDGMAHHLEADVKLLQRCRLEIEKWARARKLDPALSNGAPPAGAVSHASLVEPTAPPPLSARTLPGPQKEEAASTRVTTRPWRRSADARPVAVAHSRRATRSATL